MILIHSRSGILTERSGWKQLVLKVLKDQPDLKVRRAPKGRPGQQVPKARRVWPDRRERQEPSEWMVQRVLLVLQAPLALTEHKARMASPVHKDRPDRLELLEHKGHKVCLEQRDRSVLPDHQVLKEFLAPPDQQAYPELMALPVLQER
jgi:hypothetical protein